MTDVWDERPEFPKWKVPYTEPISTPDGDVFAHYDDILEWKKKEDAWLEKLRSMIGVVC